jgi:signal transduction histidine kinase
MRVDSGASISHVSPRDPLTASLRMLGRFPQRIRERRFWEVQILLIGAATPHYVLEMLGHRNPAETIHDLAITLYILPLLYAAIAYGWEGAVLTGLWSAALTSPSIWIWHRGEFHWATELAQISVTLAVGIVVASRVDLETKQRLRAERTSASLQLLNEVVEILSHTLEVEQQLPKVVERLQSALELEFITLKLEPDSDGNEPALVVSSPAPAPPGADRPRSRDSTRGSGTLVVPLVGETGTLGSLTAAAATGDSIEDAQADLITTVAQDLRVAIENARLYRQRQESLQIYARQVTQAQEDERLRIARELHDDTAQELVMLSRKLEDLKSRVKSEQVRDIEDLLTMTRGTIQAVRRFSRDLRPSILDDLGLRAALEMVVEDTGNRLPKGANLQVTGSPRRLDGPLELALFRIAQEALRNAEKHSGATSVDVELDFGTDGVTLEVSDDGKGFSTGPSMSEMIRKGKLGLVGMKERAELVGGTLHVLSSHGGGTKVTVQTGTA